MNKGLDALGLGGVIAEDTLRGLIAQARPECEVIVTDREASEWLLAEADLMSVLQSLLLRQGRSGVHGFSLKNNLFK